MLLASDYSDFFDNKYVSLVLGVAGLAILSAIGYYVVGKLRGSYRESEVDQSGLLTNFREMHALGELTDEEYRNIKAKLAAQLRAQFDISDEPDFKER